MAGNTQPQFTAAGDIAGVVVTAAWAESYSGFVIGTSGFLAFTAGANGSYVDFLRWFPTASSVTTTGATIGRVFVSSVTTGTPTASQAFCISEINLPSISAGSSSVAQNAIDIPLGFRLPASWGICVTNHAAPTALTEWCAVVFGGDY